MSGHKCCVLAQIKGWWVQGRLIAAMGHNSERGVVVVSVCASSWSMIGGAVHAMEVGWWLSLCICGENLGFVLFRKPMFLMPNVTV